MTIARARRSPSATRTGTSAHNVAFNAAGPQPDRARRPSPTVTAPGSAAAAARRFPRWAGNCTFANSGTYAFYCVAHPAMTGTVVVAAANAPPTVTASRNPTGDVTTGTSIAFTATGTDADGDTLTYAWDFGDGGTASGAEPSHAYTTRAPTPRR